MFPDIEFYISLLLKILQIDILGTIIFSFILFITLFVDGFLSGALSIIKVLKKFVLNTFLILLVLMILIYNLESDNSNFIEIVYSKVGNHIYNLQLILYAFVTVNLLLFIHLFNRIHVNQVNKHPKVSTKIENEVYRPNSMKELYQLRESGVISEQEFNEYRNKLKI